MENEDTKEKLGWFGVFLVIVLILAAMLFIIEQSCSNKCHSVYTEMRPAISYDKFRHCSCIDRGGSQTSHLFKLGIKGWVEVEDGN